MSKDANDILLDRGVDGLRRDWDTSFEVRPPDDGAKLLDDVHAFLGRIVAYPSKETHTAHTLWIAHAHLMEAWESTPRITFLSPEPSSGKTRALEITELLVPRPVQAVNVSPAYLFRKVADPGGLPDHSLRRDRHGFRAACPRQ